MDGEDMRRMIYNNLIKNSIAAYFASIEIHNKPNIPYRYETTTLLMTNAWELVLKAYVYKYVDKRYIFEDKMNGHTIKLSTAVTYVYQDINKKEGKGKFDAIKANIDLLEEYRNSIAHFYNKEMEPYIFMVLARAAINFSEFVKKYFNKDVIENEGIFIMPIGFKLPFHPIDFLSTEPRETLFGKESQKYVNHIIETIKSLDDIGVEDSVIVGFDVYLNSIKKELNADIIAAISENAKICLTVEKKIQITEEKGAQKMQLTDDEIFRLYPYGYNELANECKKIIPGFKKSKRYNHLKELLKGNTKYSYQRFLRKNAVTNTYLYNDKAIKYISDHYYDDNE